MALFRSTAEQRIPLRGYPCLTRPRSLYDSLIVRNLLLTTKNVFLSPCPRILPQSCAHDYTQWSRKILPLLLEEETFLPNTYRPFLFKITLTGIYLRSLRISNPENPISLRILLYVCFQCDFTCIVRVRIVACLSTMRRCNGKIARDKTNCVEENTRCEI